MALNPSDYDRKRPTEPLKCDRKPPAPLEYYNRKPAAARVFANMDANGTPYAERDELGRSFNHFNEVQIKKMEMSGLKG